MSVEEATLLIVEDDRDALLLLERALRKAKLRTAVRVVTDGDAAVAYLAGHDKFGDRLAHPLPCLVLLNLKLPKRSGLEVLEWMRDKPRLRRIPVIIITTSDEERDRRRACELGAREYCIKPIEWDSLLRLARKVEKYTSLFSARIRELIDRDGA